MFKRAILLPSILGVSLLLSGCGGITDPFGGGTVTGDFTFSNTTGTPPFSLSFKPTQGSLISNGQSIPSWTGQASVQLTTPSSNLQEMDFTMFGALSAGSSLSVSAGGTTSMIFHDRIDSTTDNDAYTATGGTIHVDAIDGDNYTLTFTNLTLVAGPAAPHPGSTATLNGTLTITLAV